MLNYNVNNVNLSVEVETPLDNGWYLLHLSGADGVARIEGKGVPVDLIDSTLSDEENAVMRYLWAEGELNRHFTDSYRETW